jgi:hypothetical protein
MRIRNQLFYRPAERIVATTGSDKGFFRISPAYDPARSMASEVFVFYPQKNALNDVVCGAGNALEHLLVPV